VLHQDSAGLTLWHGLLHACEKELEEHDEPL
jgi:hypothetical protein